MELSKRTTILFPTDLYQQLVRLAKQRDSCMGELVRSACRAQYSLVNMAARLAAVRKLATMSLPVGTPVEMERESMPPAEPLP